MLTANITNLKFCIYANGPLKLSAKKKVNITSANKNSNLFFFENSSTNTDKPAAAIKPPNTPAIITIRVVIKIERYSKKRCSNCIKILMLL